MGKALKMTRFRNVKIKVVRRTIAGPAKFSYLSQGLPQPSYNQTHPSDASITSQPAEPDDVTPSCSESAYSKAKKRELHAWDAVKDEMLKVSFECSAPITTQCAVCREHADYRCIECSSTAVFCEVCLKRIHRNSLHLPEKWNNWIGNYKRSQTTNASSEPRPSKAKVQIRELSPYNLFCRDILKNKGTMNDIKGRWATLGEDAKQKYIQEAAALRAHGQAQDLNPEMRDARIKMHLKKLKLEVSKLEDLGVETAILSFDRKKSSLEVFELSSKGATDFLDSTDTVNNFALHFKASSSAATPCTREHVSVLVGKVKDLFNRKYKEAGGTGRLPYQSLVNQGLTIKVSGLPNSLTLKKPSFYGRNQLVGILQAADEITFEMEASQCSHTDMGNAEGMPEQMDAEDTAEGIQPKAVEEILEAVCENGVQQMEESSETATTVAIVMTEDKDGGNLCCVCHIHFDDRKKNARKKWRSWSQCTVCESWSHTACGFKKNMCVHCQCQDTMQTP